MSSYHRIIGIDLGTCFSRVAVWDHDTHTAIMIPDAAGIVDTPSIVSVDPAGHILVGAAARSNLVYDPANTVTEIKREMRQPHPHILRGRDYLPHELAAFILMYLKHRAERFLGKAVHDAVITVPLSFGQQERAATLQAAQLARLNVRQLLNASSAAAVAFAQDKIQDTHSHSYVVYDLGGGSFDVSILEIQDNNITVVSNGGDLRLGGVDFDDRITRYALNQIKQQYGQDLSQDPQILLRIKREAELRKRELSAFHSASLNLPYLTPTLSVNIPITRVIFESLINDLLERSLKILDETIGLAEKNRGTMRGDIEQVLLVGGSSRIPKVRQILCKHMGINLEDIRQDINPEQDVARGAAMVARGFHLSDGYKGEESAIPDGTLANIERFKSSLQPPKETFNKLVNDCYEMNRTVTSQATEKGVLHDQVEITKSIDALRTQGERAWAAKDQKQYTDSLSMLQGIHDHLAVIYGSILPSPQIDPIQEALQYVGYARELTASTLNPAWSQSQTALPIELEEILRKLETDAPDHPAQVKQTAGQIIQRLTQIAKILNNPHKAETLLPGLVDSGQRHSISNISNDWDAIYRRYMPQETRRGSPSLPEATVDRVHFTVTAPTSVAAETTFVVDVWAHLEEQREIVIARAHQAAPGQALVIKTKGHFQIAQGSVLSVRLKFDSLVVQDPEDTILWEGQVGNATFAVLVASDVKPGPQIGQALVYLNGLQIATIHFTIHIGQSSIVASEIVAHVERHTKAFASYSSADRDEVLARIQGMLKANPQLEVFLDVLTLRSGQNWEQELWEAIPANDVFYLFWSEHAKQSEWVEKEWRCALHARGLDFIDPCPLVPPERATPPPELASKHFNDWTLAFMRNNNPSKANPT